MEDRVGKAILFEEVFADMFEREGERVRNPEVIAVGGEDLFTCKDIAGECDNDGVVSFLEGGIGEVGVGWGMGWDGGGFEQFWTSPPPGGGIIIFH